MSGAGTRFGFGALASDCLACLVGAVFNKHNTAFSVPSRWGQTFQSVQWFEDLETRLHLTDISHTVLILTLEFYASIETASFTSAATNSDARDSKI